MATQNLKDIFWNGVWKQNTGLAQLLGLCPILAVSTNLVNGVSLGLATIAAMAMSNAVVSALRNFIPYEIRIPVFILIIAALVWPFFGSRGAVDIATLILIYVLLGLGLNIVVGLAGLLDLGYVAFYAIGAYGLALGYQYLGLGFWAMLPLGAVMAALAGALLGFPVLRMHGDYLAIVTLGFGEVIRQCHQRHPEFEITFTELSPERQKQALSRKEIDLGLARFADTVNIHPLLAETIYRESMVLVVSDEHPLRDRKLVSLPELAGEPFVLMSRANSSSTDLIINACLVEGFYPRLHQEVVEPNTLMAVVATSQQVALVPASYARQKWPHVRFIRLEQGIPADLCVLYAPPLAGQPATTAIRHFIDTMSEQMNLPERG